MKKFHFPLQRMLDFKQEILEGEKLTLRRFQTERQSIENKIEALDLEFAEIDTQAKEKAATGITAIEMRSFQFQLENIRRLKKALFKDLKAALERIEEQMQKVIQASQEVSSLEKLRDKKLEDYQSALTKAEELEITEFLTTKLVQERQGV